MAQEAHRKILKDCTAPGTDGVHTHEKGAAHTHKIPNLEHEEVAGLRGHEQLLGGQDEVAGRRSDQA